MVGQQVLFAAETATVHQLGGSLSLMQIALVRGAGGLLLVVVLARGRVCALMRTGQPLLQISRGLTAVAYLWVFAFSYSTLPLTDATGLSYSTAIYIALLAPLILGERVGAARWMAVAVGFGGAMLIVKPGFQTFSLAYLLVLAGTSLNGLAFVLTKLLERRDSPLTVMLWLNVITILCFSPGLHGVSEMPPSPWLIGLVVLGPAGQYLGILALRHADASMLAPVNYVRLILAGGAAFLVFGEWPDLASILGATVIFASCVLAVRWGSRDAILAGRASEPPPV
jgi:drug/metabolite transporter (DMT)-like permease